MDSGIQGIGIDEGAVHVRPLGQASLESKIRGTIVSIR